MKKLFPFILFLLAYFPSTINAQAVTKDWDKRFGGSDTEQLYCTRLVNDQLWITGFCSSSGIEGDKTEANSASANAWFIKVQTDGTLISDKTFGGTGGGMGDYTLNFMVNGNQIVFFCGSNTKIGAQKSENPYDQISNFDDGWLVKTDLNGIVVKDKTLGWTDLDGFVNGIKLIDGYLIMGYTKSDQGGDVSENSRGGYDIWLVKTDFNFQKQWDKRYGGNLDESVALNKSIVPTEDGNLFVLGNSTSPVGGDKTAPLQGVNDYWLLKITTDGNKIWDKTYGGSLNDRAYGILKLDSGYMLYGYSVSNIGGDKSENSRGGADYWVVKIDENGNKLWDKTYGSSASDQLKAMIPTLDGGFLLAGHSTTGFSGERSEGSWGQEDYWIVKIDANGNKLWDKTFGSNGRDFLIDVVQLPDKSYMLAGYTDGGISGDKSQASRGREDYWILKTTPDTAQGPFALEEVQLNALVRLNEVSLQWTDTRSSIQHYAVLHLKSQNPFVWDTIAYTSNRFFHHPKPNNGPNFYQICRLDERFSCTLSNIAQANIWRKEEVATVNLYPNPAKDFINVTYRLNPTETSRIEIYNTQGAKVFHIPILDAAGNTTVNTSEWAEGIYLCRVINSNQILFETKIQVYKE